MDVVLDLDLDFFVWPIIHWPPWGPSERMPQTSVQYLASEAEVRRFLEDHCSLSRSESVSGRQIVKHDEAFFVWRDWIADGTLRVPFKVVHVDAHADLGLGDAGYVYLTTQLLALPQEQRKDPQRGPDGIGEGNYLAFALANRWISELLYVFPNEPASIGVEREAGLQEWRQMMGIPDAAIDGVDPANPEPPPADDLLAVHFRDYDSRTKFIELKQYATRAAAVSAAGGDRGRQTVPLQCEPQVPFDAIAASAFRTQGITHVVIAQSPAYTPESADGLLPIVAEYVSRDVR